MTTNDLILYYAPRSRSFTALWLLEELGVDYRLESFDLAAGRHKEPDYLQLNPMGKVPMVVDRGRAVPELGAMAIYLSDLHPAAGLAPAEDDASRPDFLRWIFFSSAIVEPAFAEKMFGWEQHPSNVAWGSFDEMLRVLNDGLGQNTWLLGEKFSAADVLVGSGVRFGTLFGVLPKTGPIADYLRRCTEREAFKRAAAIEAREGERFPHQPPASNKKADEDESYETETHEPTGRDSQIDYIEFDVESIARSKAFYGEAFGWTFTDYGSDYCSFSDGRLEGGFAQVPGAGPGGPLVILYADDLEGTQQRVKNAGAEILKPIFDFPGGRRFHFADPDGYELAVWSAE
jgi:glutathione S-transferase